ncbi:hypothetical protein Pmar_PMAR001413 [Perkinsus marinus ATCC 50983]|uniref:Transmembrane protein n=1 Tax=Perkinsus marinus (strain ATCC 50983 / TXsc) TaxID=423536 RepID=C5KJM7_PERM5|nr:hypothetical protein Pmar_PMAR001413 [Perkinsus marinus ATCC 50983]EER15361.1 hypothetical protein Pmar_PMAR001413 [Perkinsus marinus ATCC 50983]|eukprot:XP_002783565.1 hypothetical protein Pmar_PMAR001413 [Perkinsus marinus ATCC 50983]
MVATVLNDDLLPPTSPTVSALSAESEASFKSARARERLVRPRVVESSESRRGSLPLVRSWFSKAVSASSATTRDDTPGMFEQVVVVAFAVISSHSDAALWQKKVYWYLLALAATSLVCVCVVPPGTGSKQTGVIALLGSVPRRICDFFMLRWPSIIATALAYRNLVLVAFPMSLGYYLSLVFSCYRLTMYFVYVVTYLSYSFPLTTLLLFPFTVIVGPKYLRWVFLLLGWSTLIYIVISGLIGMYTVNTVTQIRVPSVLAWRFDHFGQRSRRRSSRKREHVEKRPHTRITTPAPIRRKAVASLKSEVRPIILDKPFEGDQRGRLGSLTSQSTIASVGRSQSPDRSTPVESPS